MSEKREKQYFRLKTLSDWDYLFESNKWDTLRFAGGWNGKRKFIISSLVSLFWEQEWIDIFNKFLEWVDNIRNVSWFWSDTWVFVLYPRKNVFKD